MTLKVTFRQKKSPFPYHVNTKKLMDDFDGKYELSFTSISDRIAICQVSCWLVFSFLCREGNCFSVYPFSVPWGPLRKGNCFFLCILSLLVMELSVCLIYGTCFSSLVSSIPISQNQTFVTKFAFVHVLMC